MNWIDYTIFAVLFFAAAFGLASGPALQLLKIGCLLLSFFAAIFFHSILVGILKGIFTPSTAGLLSYFIVFGVAFIATYILTDIPKEDNGRVEDGLWAQAIWRITRDSERPYLFVVWSSLVSCCFAPSRRVTRSIPQRLQVRLEKGCRP